VKDREHRQNSSGRRRWKTRKGKTKSKAIFKELIRRQKERNNLKESSAIIENEYAETPKKERKQN
jgi:hypothetical protein